MELPGAILRCRNAGLRGFTMQHLNSSPLFRVSAATRQSWLFASLNGYDVRGAGKASVVLVYFVAYLVRLPAT